MSKHAYLIIAHHEFEVLSRLLLSIDDERNDIYIHFDKKVKSIPSIQVNNANLFILKDRVDVRWGDISQIVCEFLLLKESYSNGSYHYYHILSGVDMPLKSQNEIHDFFTRNLGKEFIGFTQGNIEKEIDRKVRRIHLFPTSFKGGNKFCFTVKRIVRFLFLRLQIITGFRRNKDVVFKKGTSWVSITNDFVGFVLPKFKEIMRMYHHSFCADEIFLHTICWNSEFRGSIFNSKSEMSGCMRMIRWDDNQLIDWTDEDFEHLMDSEAIFARKFNSENMEIINRILKVVL